MRSSDQPVRSRDCLRRNPDRPDPNPCCLADTRRRLADNFGNRQRGGIIARLHRSAGVSRTPAVSGAKRRRLPCREPNCPCAVLVEHGQAIPTSFAPLPAAASAQPGKETADNRRRWVALRRGLMSQCSSVAAGSNNPCGLPSFAYRIAMLFTTRSTPGVWWAIAMAVAISCHRPPSRSARRCRLAP